MRSARLLIASGVLVGLTAGCDSRFTPQSTALQLRGVVYNGAPTSYPIPSELLLGGDIHLGPGAQVQLRVFTDLWAADPDTIVVDGTYERFGPLFLFTTGQGETEERFAGAANSAGAFDALSVGALPAALRIPALTPYELRFTRGGEPATVEITSGEAIQAVGQLVRIGPSDTDSGGLRTLYEMPAFVGAGSPGSVEILGATLELEGTAFDLHLQMLFRPRSGDPQPYDESYHGRIARFGTLLIFDSGAAVDAFGIFDEGSLTLYDVKLASDNFPWNSYSYTWEFAVESP